MFYVLVGSKLNFCTNCTIANLHKSEDRDEELDPEARLGKTNSVLRILIQKVGQECEIPSVIINHRL